MEETPPDVGFKDAGIARSRSTQAELSRGRGGSMESFFSAGLSYATGCLICLLLCCQTPPQNSKIRPQAKQ